MRAKTLLLYSTFGLLPLFVVGALFSEYGLGDKISQSLLMGMALLLVFQWVSLWTIRRFARIADISDNP